jgi:hypothetical protein
MKIKPRSSVLFSIRNSAIAALALAGCNDERLRELGYTLDQAGASLGDGSDEVYEPCVPEFVDADLIQREIAADLAAAPQEDRPFLRYLSLADRIDAGLCSDGLEFGRDGVSRLINSLSREPSIVVPKVFGPEGGVLRIDLRDYGWTRAVDVDGRVFSDGWEAVIDSTGLAVELAGEQGSSIAEQTHTRVPVLNALAFIDAAASSKLYYALLGVPATLGELRASVGLPSDLDPLANGATRTVTDASRIVRLTGTVRVIDRYAIAAGTRGTYHEAEVIDTGAFFADPLHVQPPVQRLISFSLPNDLRAFAITDPAGALRGAAEFVLDTNRDDFTATVLASCSNCHANGLIPATDVARSAVLGHPDQFDAEVVAAFQASLNEEQLAAQVEADSLPFQQAVERSTGTSEGADPVALNTFEFSVNVDLARAAADLLVSPDELRSRLDELAVEFIPLGLDLPLSRAQFSTLYAGAYCVLHAADENPPRAAFCDQEP